MQSIEAIAAAWRMGALVFIERDGETQIRPAAFIFLTPTGFAWVEPSFADPWGSASPAFHSREGLVEVAGDGLRWQGRDETITLLTYEPEIDADLVGDALTWWTRHVAENGIDLDAERERVRALCLTAE